MKPEIFIFDIDGTLANHEGVRGPFDEHLVFYDKVITPVAKVLRSLYSYGFQIVFVSGRTEKCREATQAWLAHNIFFSPNMQMELYMRQIGDSRNDAIVKKEIYDKFITPKYEVIGVFDDRMRVCRMLYENSIFCFNVNQGLKEF